MKKNMQIGDLIKVSKIPAVVQLAEVSALKERLNEEGENLLPETIQRLRNYLEEYFITEADNRAAVESVLSCLSEDSGRGFFIKGVYGSGKSHFLALLSLLCQYPIAWKYFLTSHPEYQGYFQNFKNRKFLVVQIALDEYTGKYGDLEDIVFSETESELQRHNIYLPLVGESYALELIQKYVLPQFGDELDEFVAKETGEKTNWEELSRLDIFKAINYALKFLRQKGYPLEFKESRVERLARLQQILRDNNFGGLILLIDELSVFLSTKTREDLHNDASFLQFLGQRSRFYPIWVIATLQKNIEDVGDIDAYILRQIKDRFNTRLHLSITQVKEIIDKKLIKKPNWNLYTTALEELHQNLSERFGGLSFSKEELKVTYPLHPLTLECLEFAATSFLSKTRTIIDFVQSQVGGDEGQGIKGLLRENFTKLLTPDVLFDHFEGTLQGHPELKKYYQVYEYFQRNIQSISPQNAGLALKIIKGLIVLRIANLNKSIKEIGEGIMPNLDLPPVALYEHLQAILEDLRTRGAYLEVQHRRGNFEDIYTVDLEAEINQTIRRRINSHKQGLADDDRRIMERVVQACSQRPLNLKNYLEPKLETVEWRNTKRTVSLEFKDLMKLSPEDLSNLIFAISETKSKEDCQIYLGSPLQVNEQREAWLACGKELRKERWTNALISWLPREITASELEMLKEYTAFYLLLEDPTLKDSQQGMAIFNKLNENKLMKDAEMKNLIHELYWSGEVLDLLGVLLDKEALSAHRGDWESTLKEIAQGALDKLFPQFEDFAPKRKLLSRGPTHQIINEFIRLGKVQIPPFSTLDNYIRDYAEPLGIVKGEEGEYELRVTKTPLFKFLLSLASEKTTRSPSSVLVLEELEKWLAKSNFGLPEELSEIIIAALVKEGYLVSFDRERQPIPASKLAAPLREYIEYLAPAHLVEPQYIPEIAKLAKLWLNLEISEFDFPVQEEIWEKLIKFKKEHLANIEILLEKMTQLQKALGQEDLQWLDAQNIVEEMESLLNNLDINLNAQSGLKQFLEKAKDYLTEKKLLNLTKDYQSLTKFLKEQAQYLIDIHNYLSNTDLALKENSLLDHQKQELLGLLSLGDKLVYQYDKFHQLANNFLSTYANQYITWHQRLSSFPQFERYSQIKETKEYKLLSQLKKLALGVPWDKEAVDQIISQELGKRCSEPLEADKIRETPVCPSCKRKFLSSIALVPPEKVEELIRYGINKYIETLQRPERQKEFEKYLLKHKDNQELTKGFNILLRLPKSADSAKLLKLFSDRFINEINKALKLKPSAIRRLADLTNLLSHRELNKSQIIQIFQNWLDEKQELGEEELIKIE